MLAFIGTSLARTQLFDSSKMPPREKLVFD